MKLDRERLLNDLQVVRPGLDAREFIEQSSYFVFQDGMVMTFNDKVACRKPVSLPITGAVEATLLLTVLKHCGGEEVDIRANGQGKLEIHAQKQSFSLKSDSEVFLPIERVEHPEHWDRLPSGLLSAISKVLPCVGTDESKFLLTCVHIHPEYVEACDNVQMMRCSIKTGAPKPVHVRGDSLQHVMACAVDEVAWTKQWIHFRSKTTGLIISCRCYSEEYPKLDEYLGFKGHRLRFPAELAKAIERVSCFSRNKRDFILRVAVSSDTMCLKGEHDSSCAEENIEIHGYEGPPFEFTIPAEVFMRICKKYPHADIAKDRLTVSGDGWEYVAVISQPICRLAGDFDPNHDLLPQDFVAEPGTPDGPEEFVPEYDLLPQDFTGRLPRQKHKRMANEAPLKACPATPYSKKPLP